MKFAKLSLVALATLGLTSSVFATDSVEAMFKDGKVSGEIRALYMNTDVDNGTDTDSFGIGGSLGFETASYNGLSLGAKFYTDQNGGFADNGFVTEKTVLGQAYLQYKVGNTLLKVGRQQLDTPLAGSDDIRIIPNLFEAYLLVNTDLPDTTVILAHVAKGFGEIDMASGSTFKSMSEQAGATYAQEGVNVGAVVYAGLPNTTLQAWYYNATDVLDAVYTDLSYENKIAGLDFSFGAQYYTLDSDSEYENKTGGKIDYDVYGLKGSLSGNGLTATIAYNSVDVKPGSATVHGAWGGYPEYAFSDEYWMVSTVGSEDLDVTKFALDYDAGFATFSAAYTMYDTTTNGADTDVLDIIANWECKFLKGLNITAVYENQDVDSGNDTDMVKLTMSYAF